MITKILMNKNTLAALKLELREFETALPVFEMKEQQLKDVIQSVEESIARLKISITSTIKETSKWVAVLVDQDINLTKLIQVKKVVTEPREIAGVETNDFANIEFEPVAIDKFSTPLWLDAALEILQDQKTRNIMLDIEKKKYDILISELQEARRMKNALKEVFIPEAKENIRKIEIYLGDLERLAIGCAKLVKKKKLSKANIP